MSFLQPWLLWALPLIAIPIIIHFVNQWRYQTKPWAAMMFLLAAQSMHRGLAKLRQWLILAMRVLAIAGLIFAVSRPLTSGMMGLVAGGRVDTTIVMLDRSPSMLQQGIRSRESKLATGLRQLHQTLATQSSSRWILIDSAKPWPQEFASLDTMLDGPIADGTSAIGIWPVMFQSALDYIQTNRPSQTSIWICSDMRQGDWQTEQGGWPVLRDAFQKLPSPVRFFAITYPEIASTNRALSVNQVRWERNGENGEVVLTIRIQRQGSSNQNETVPVQLAIGNGRSEVDVELVHGIGEVKDHRVAIDEASTPGWGRATIPADDAAADNEIFFVFDESPVRQTILVTESPELIYPLRIAAEITNSPRSQASVEVVEIDAFDKTNIDDASMIIWQGPLPKDQPADRLVEHLERGRSIWFLPPSAMIDQGTSSSSETTFHGFRWMSWAQAPTPVRPVTWRTDEGVLAATQSGMALPIGEISVTGYATMDGPMTPLATLDGGSPLFAKLDTDRGNAFVCATLPIERTSTLATNGIALFVAAQRSIDLASATLGNAIAYSAVPILQATGEKSNSAKRTATTATGNPPTTVSNLNLTPVDTWQPIVTDDRFLSNEIGLHSGVFESASKLVAVNRPSAEDIGESLDDEQFAKLFKGLDIVRIEDSAGSSRSIQQEIWRIFLVLMIAALLFEALFSMPIPIRHRDAKPHSFPV